MSNERPSDDGCSAGGAQLVEVLATWQPATREEGAAPGAPYPPPSHPAAGTLVSLFEGHALTLAHLVPALLRLYAEAEHSGGSGSQGFYYKVRRGEKGGGGRMPVRKPGLLPQSECPIRVPIMR